MKAGDRIIRIEGSWGEMKVGDRATIKECTSQGIKLKEFVGIHSEKNLKVIGREEVIYA